VTAPARAGRDSLPRRLGAHCAALARCRKCGLPVDVRPIISVARTPRAMLIGQAPGRVEAGSGRPFSGRAGRTLFRWLERAGLDEDTARSRIYFAAVTRCYPGGSPTGRGDRVPTARERALCSDWLERELRIIRPSLLIPVGRLAIERFLGARPLTDVIGRVHQVRHEGGSSRAIPLPHPSGASGWLNVDAHRRLVDRALDLLAGDLTALGIALDDQPVG